MAEQTNPYMALMQQEEQAPSTAQLLRMFANLVGGASAGIGQTGTWGGIAPGLFMGINANAQDADQAEKRRMRQAEIGIQASKWDEERKQRAAQEAAVAAYAKGPGIPGVNVQPTPYQLGPGTSDQNAIGGIESGGRYDAVGPAANDKGQRAYGKYQVMDFNIGPWTQEVLGRPMTPQEFLANPQAQDAVFNAKFGQYSQKYGPVGASRAWFAGEGGMNNPNARDVNGMTVQRYGDRFAQSRGVASAPVGPPPVGPGGAGPTLSALPGFEGPGMGTIQPSALPAGVEPKVNLPAPFVPPPPPQVAQGDSVTPGGSQVDPNAPAPPWTGQAQPPTPGGPNVVQAQYKPTPATPPMGQQARPPVLRSLPPEIEQRINGLVAMRAITIPQAEKMKQDAQQAQYQGDLKAWEVGQTRATEDRKIQATIDAEMRKLHTDTLPMKDAATGRIRMATKAEILAGLQSGKLIPPEDSEEDRKQVELAMKQGADKRDAERLELDKRKADEGTAQLAVDPKTMRPNPAAIDAKAAAAAAEAKARQEQEVPIGYRRKEGGSLEPVPGGPADPTIKPPVTPKELADLRVARSEGETMVKALNDFKQEWKKAGTADSLLSLGGASTPLNTSYNIAALLAKGEQLFNLGVLTGPDLEIIRRTLPDPSTVRGAMTSTENMEDAVDKVTQLVEGKLRAREKNLGVEPANIRPPEPATGAAPATTPSQSMQPKSGDPLEGRTATGPNGQKVVRQNGQWVPVR